MKAVPSHEGGQPTTPQRVPKCQPQFLPLPVALLRDRSCPGRWSGSQASSLGCTHGQQPKATQSLYFKPLLKW